MNKLKNISAKEYEYPHYNDYVFKQTVQKYADGVLKLLGIPYTINNIILAEITDFGPKIHRLDFAVDVTKNNEEISFVLECQSKLPNDDDILRFFQYASSLLTLKKEKSGIIHTVHGKSPL